MPDNKHPNALPFYRKRKYQVAVVASTLIAIAISVTCILLLTRDADDKTEEICQYFSTTETYRELLVQIKKHEHYVDEKNAEVLFLNIDTFHDLYWPGYLSQKWTGHHCIYKKHERIIEHFQSMEWEKYPELKVIVIFRNMHFWGTPSELLKFFTKMKSHIPTNIEMVIPGYDWTKDRQMSEFNGFNLLPLLAQPNLLREPVVHDQKTSYKHDIIFGGNWKASETREKFKDWWLERKESEQYKKWEIALTSKLNFQDYFDTIFGLDLEGDNHWTVRFTELLSMGLIPVVCDDKRVFPPILPEGINSWDDIVVHLKDCNNKHDTLHSILEDYDADKIKTMKQNGHKVAQLWGQHPQQMLTYVLDWIKGYKDKKHPVGILEVS